MSDRKVGAARNYPHAIRMSDASWPRWHKLECIHCSWHEIVHRTNVSLSMLNAPLTCVPPSQKQYRDPAVAITDLGTGEDVKITLVPVTGKDIRNDPR